METEHMREFVSILFNNLLTTVRFLTGLRYRFLHDRHLQKQLIHGLGLLIHQQSGEVEDLSIVQAPNSPSICYRR